jgi:hypothetical protein
MVETMRDSHAPPQDLLCWWQIRGERGGVTCCALSPRYTASICGIEGRSAKTGSLSEPMTLSISSLAATNASGKTREASTKF